MTDSSLPQGACMNSVKVSGRKVSEFRAMSTSYFLFLSFQERRMPNPPRRQKVAISNAGNAK